MTSVLVHAGCCNETFVHHLSVGESVADLKRCIASWRPDFVIERQALQVKGRSMIDAEQVAAYGPFSNSQPIRLTLHFDINVDGLLGDITCMKGCSVGCRPEATKNTNVM